MMFIKLFANFKAQHLEHCKGSKNIQYGKDSFFSKWYWESRTVICKPMKSEHTLTADTKNKLKMA